MTRALVPRIPEEIIGMLTILENERENLIQLGALGAALAIGSQIQLLKWAFNMEERKCSE